MHTISFGLHSGLAPTLLSAAWGPERENTPRASTQEKKSESAGEGPLADTGEPAGALLLAK